MRWKSRIGITILTGGIVLVIASLLSISIGSYPLSFGDILRIVKGECQDAMSVRVFYTLRIPRVCVGLLSGFSLGISGAVFQLLFQNPLASPDLVGVSSGASLGSAASIVLGAGSVAEMMAGSFLGGMGALGVVLLLVKISGRKSTGTYILAGIMISAFSNALIMILKYMADTEGELAAIDFWTMGSLASVTYHKLRIIVVPIVIVITLILFLRKEVLILSLGDDQASSLGMNSNAMRMLLLTLCTVATASVITVTGVISFVGLLAPHITFLMTGRRSSGFLLGSGIFGSILVLVADCFARSAVHGELPTSILTTLCALPFFLYFMYKQKGGAV